MNLAFFQALPITIIIIITLYTPPSSFGAITQPI